MRRFAWGCVVAGLLVAVCWPLYVGSARVGADARARAALERAQGPDGPGIPGGPWELERRLALRASREAHELGLAAGVLVGAGLAGFGVLLLALRPPSRVAAPASLLLAVVLLAGCASSRGATTFRHPATGDVRACEWTDPPGIWTEMLCVPCYYAWKDSYPRCKRTLEEKGYVLVEALSRVDQDGAACQREALREPAGSKPSDLSPSAIEINELYQRCMRAKGYDRGVSR